MKLKLTAALTAAGIALGVAAAPAAATTYGGIVYEADTPYTVNGYMYGESYFGGTATATGYLTTHLMRRDSYGNWYAFVTKQVTLIRGVNYAWTYHHPRFACSPGGAYAVRTQVRFASGAWDISSAPTLTCKW